MVDFAGWAMPIQYDGIVSEHRRVRSTAGLFDVSHMGEFIVEGEGALEAIERVTTNRAASLGVGRVQYSAFCYDDGGFVDDLLVYRLRDSYMLVVNASNKDKDFDWVRDHFPPGVSLRDASDETALLALQGPDSEQILSRLTAADLASLGYYHSTEAEVAGIDVLVSRTGYTGEDGFEIYLGLEPAPAVWDALMEAGRANGVEPVGLGCRDTLRLEMGYALYGNDIDSTRTPVESGLMWITKLGKGDFIGRDAIARRKESGADVKLVGFEFTGRGVPRHGQRILKAGEEIGVVTSGTFSPSLERGIGMGYVPADHEGDFEVETRSASVEARVVSLPFYKHGTVKR